MKYTDKLQELRLEYAKVRASDLPEDEKQKDLRLIHARASLYQSAMKAKEKLQRKRPATGKTLPPPAYTKDELKDLFT